MSSSIARTLQRAARSCAAAAARRTPLHSTTLAHSRHPLTARITASFTTHFSTSTNSNTDSTSNASISNTDSTSTSTPTDTNTSTSTTTSSTPSQSGVFSLLSREWGHFREHYSKYNTANAAQRVNKKNRVWPVLKRTYADMRDNGKPKVVVKTDAEGNMTLEDSDAAYEGTTALQVTDHETVWDKRLSAAREWLTSGNPLLRSTRRAVRNIDASEDSSLKPVVERVRAAKQAAEEKIEDWREYYETSQDPLFWRVRDIAEMVVGETEMGIALGELKRIDPAWNVQDFLEDMQQFFIPVVLEAMLVGDMLLLKQLCQDQAAMHVYTQWKENEAKKIAWDTRILNLRHVELTQAKVDRDEPLLVLTFQAQHVHVARCLVTQKIVEGSESEIKTVHYVWVLKRDYSSPYDYKLVSAVNQKVYQLV